MNGKLDHALGIAGLGLLGAAVIGLRVTPEMSIRSDLAAMRAEASHLESQIARYSDHLASQRAATDAIRELLDAPGRDGASGEGINVRLSLLNTRAEQVGVVVNTVRTGASAVEGELIRRVIDASYSGTAAQMLSFLQAIQDEFPDFAVDGITIQRLGSTVADGTENIASVRFDLRLRWTVARTE